MSEIPDWLAGNIVDLGTASAAFTVRQGGRSQGHWAGLNLSPYVGDDVSAVLSNRRLVERELDLEGLVGMRQVHGDELLEAGVADPGSASPSEPHCDAIWTSKPRLGILAVSADCLPVALSCGERVAVVHAGWRGLRAGIVERSAASLLEAAGGRGELMAAIGPAAGPCCYEVSDEVIRAFEGNVVHDGSMLDLAATAERRLGRAGAAAVATVSACTICDQRFYSHRRDGAPTGRQGVIAWLNS